MAPETQFTDNGLIVRVDRRRAKDLEFDLTLGRRRHHGTAIPGASLEFVRGALGPGERREVLFVRPGDAQAVGVVDARQRSPIVRESLGVGRGGGRFMGGEVVRNRCTCC